MKRWIVTITYGAPFIGTALVEVDSNTREHAALLAQRERKWPAGSTFCPREVETFSYTGPECWLDSHAGALFNEHGALA